MKLTMRNAFTALAAATALTIALPATPALAADHVMYTGDVWGAFGHSGKAHFNEYGDVVTICDIDADGYAVKMWVSLDKPHGPTLYSFSRGGEGNCATRRAADGGSYNLPERRNIGFLFCRYKNGVESECAGYTFYNDN